MSRLFHLAKYDYLLFFLYIGPAHPYIGEEAVAVGVCLALRDSDYIAGNHRSHGHPLAKGGSIKKAMAEIYGRVDGYCKGKGGSMHLADFSVGILGESGIVGSSVPVATGAGLASKMGKKDFVSVVFFGDGASNQGACHESMNLASIWKLPVIFVCENNQYAITNSYENSVAVDNVSDRAVAYNIVVVLDDTISTGGSLFQAINAIEDFGCNISLVLSVLDRNMGGGEKIRDKGFYYESIFEINSKGEFVWVNRYQRLNL